MIKRRFYNLEHGDRDALDPSSSDSDFEIEAEATDESEDDSIPEVKQDDEADSIYSGYKSEDSSAKDVDVNSSGLLFSDDDAGTINDRPKLKNRELSSKLDSEVLERKPKVLLADENESLPADVSSYVLKCKSVFKCRICPRIICLTENTLRDHLQSKRHARSEKLLSEGRLKAMLNSDGEIKDLEVSEVQTKDTEENEENNSEGQKQNKKRLKKKKRDNAKPRKMKSTKGSGSGSGSAKKRRKNEN